MDNKARLLFRQRAEQRGLASSGRPAKAARTERASSAVGGHASASAGAFTKPPPASRGGAHGGDLPDGFFDSDGASGGGTTVSPAPPRPPRPAANPAPSRLPADFRDAPRPAPADATEERNVLAMVMGEDSDSEPDDVPAAPAPAPAAPAPPPKPAAPASAPAPSAVPGGFFDSAHDAAAPAARNPARAPPKRNSSVSRRASRRISKRWRRARRRRRTRRRRSARCERLRSKPREWTRSKVERGGVARERAVADAARGGGGGERCGDDERRRRRGRQRERRRGVRGGVPHGLAREEVVTRDADPRLDQKRETTLVYARARPRCFSRTRSRPVPPSSSSLRVFSSLVPSSRPSSPRPRGLLPRAIGYLLPS